MSIETKRSSLFSETHTKVALSATKKLWRSLDALSKKKGGRLEASDFKELKSLALTSNLQIQILKKKVIMEYTEADIRETVLREAMRNDLVDREAHAALVFDRQRVVAENNLDALAAFDRAQTAATQIERGIATLCPHQVRRATGVALVAESTIKKHKKMARAAGEK